MKLVASVVAVDAATQSVAAWIAMEPDQADEFENVAYEFFASTPDREGDATLVEAKIFTAEKCEVLGLPGPTGWWSKWTLSQEAFDSLTAMTTPTLTVETTDEPHP